MALHVCSSQPHQEHSMWLAAPCPVPPSRLYFHPQSPTASPSLGNEGCDQGHTGRLCHYTIITVRSKSSLLRACWTPCQPGLEFSGSFPRGTACPRLSKAAAAGTASPQLCGGRAAQVLLSWRRKGRTREVEKGEGFGSWRSNPALGLGMSPGFPVSSHSSLLTPQM